MFLFLPRTPHGPALQQLGGPAPPRLGPLQSVFYQQGQKWLWQPKCALTNAEESEKSLPSGCWLKFPL